MILYNKENVGLNIANYQNTDFSKVTAQPEFVLKGKRFYDETGQLKQGTAELSIAGVRWARLYVPHYSATHSTTVTFAVNGSITQLTIDSSEIGTSLDIPCDTLVMFECNDINDTFFKDNRGECFTDSENDFILPSQHAGNYLGNGAFYVFPSSDYEGQTINFDHW